MPHLASRTGLSPPAVAPSSAFRSRFACNVAVLQPHEGLATRVVWALPRSLATTGGIIRLFSLPAGTKMFQFPALAPPQGRQVKRLGLSHSEIRGSMAICAYPRLVAAYHVLHRLNEPRHPPFALLYFRFVALPLPIPACGGNAAHTFSCIVYRLSLCETFYSVPPCGRNLLTVLLVSTCQRSYTWRITDSNR